MQKKLQHQNLFVKIVENYIDWYQRENSLQRAHTERSTRNEGPIDRSVDPFLTTTKLTTKVYFLNQLKLNPIMSKNVVFLNFSTLYCSNRSLNYFLIEVHCTMRNAYIVQFFSSGMLKLRRVLKNLKKYMYEHIFIPAPTTQRLWSNLDFCDLQTLNFQFSSNITPVYDTEQYFIALYQ